MAETYFALEEVPLLYPPQCKICSIAFNGRQLLCGTDRGSLLLFEVPSYALLKVVIVSAEREEVSKVGMSPSGRIVACCLANSGVTVVHNLDWDREVTRHKAHQGSIVSAMAWSETGAFFVTGDRRGRCFRHTMTPSWASPLDVKLILQCRTPIVQLALAGRSLLVSSHRGSMVLTLGSLKDLVQGVQVGRQQRDGPNFGATFLPLSLSSAFRRHVKGLTRELSESGSTASLTAFRPGSGLGRRSSSCASESSLGLDLDGVGHDAAPKDREKEHSDREGPSPVDGEGDSGSVSSLRTPRRHGSRISLPLSPISPSQPLLCCSRPRGRLWVAEPRSGTVLATLRPGHDHTFSQDYLPYLERGSETKGADPSGPRISCVHPGEFTHAQKLVPVCVRRPPPGGPAVDAGPAVPTSCLLSFGPNGVSCLDIHPTYLQTKFHVAGLGHVSDCVTSEPGALGSNTVYILHNPTLTHLEPVAEEAETRSVGSSIGRSLHSQSNASSDMEAMLKAAEEGAGKAELDRHSAAFALRHGRAHGGHGYMVKQKADHGVVDVLKRRRRAKCHTQEHRVYPSCLSSRTACDRASCGHHRSASITSAASGATKSSQVPSRPSQTPTLTCLRVMGPAEFLARVGGPSPAARARLALSHKVADVIVLTELRAALEASLAAEAGKRAEAAGMASRSSSRASFVNIGTPLTDAGSQGSGEWVEVGKQVASPSSRADSDAAPQHAEPPPLSKEEWDAFVAHVDGLVAGQAHAPHDSFFDSDDEQDALSALPHAQSTRASVLQSENRLKGMFSSLRSALAILKSERSPQRFATAPSAPSGGVLQPGVNVGAAMAGVEDGALGTAVEAVPVPVRKAILEALLLASTPQEAASVIAAHHSSLTELPLPLVSHETVSESQALKDANRDQLELNGAVQPPGSAQATLDALVCLANDHTRDSDAAVSAAMNVLKAASRTSTGGDSFFAVQALLGDVGIITPASRTALSPVTITVSDTGGVCIQADNVFDIYSEHEFSSGGGVPVPWLRLSVVVREEGTFAHTSRVRTLSILPL